MTWRDRSSRATFRGVPFFVDNGEHNGGRQVVVHEFPFSNAAPFSEDLGKKGNSFQVTGYVLGTDYTRDRDALRVALDVEGSGELVHPYYGTRRVNAGSYRISESASEGGVARFSIEFTETSADAQQPSAVTDHGAKVTVAAASLKTSLSAQFLAAFADVSSLRASAATALRSVSTAIGAVLDTQALLTQEMAAMRSQIASLTSDAASLASAPTDLVATLQSVVEALGAGLLNVAGSLDPSGAMLALYSFDPGVRPPSTTPNRAQEQANYDAIQYAVQRLVIAEASTLAIVQTFDSYEDAVRVRSAIVDLIDEHTEAVADDAFPELMDLRAALVNAVPGTGADLPHLQHYTPGATVPSLVLSHRLYGDLDHEADILRRNGISNPGVIPGGVELEVLSS